MKLRCFPQWQRLRSLAVLLIWLPLLVQSAAQGANEPDPSRSGDSTGRTFEKDIRPILRAHCFDCHGATQELKGGLDLRQVRLMRRGGDSGPALTPGAPQESYLLDRVRNAEMPPGDNRLSADEISVLQQWIEAGAPTARPEPENLPPGLGVTPEERQYWAFQRIVRPPTPTLSSDDRVRTPVDAFLLAAMPAGRSFSPDAPSEVLVRRLYYDLLGLAPSAEEIQKWATKADPDWYEHLVDQLLSSPHYGERWARHWLDIAGYADSEGYTTADAERPWAWKYRDYVIRSLNQDKPWDRFLVEQLAGDELAGPITGDLTAEQIELLAATGFLRMAADGTGAGADTPEGRNQVMTDTLRIVSTSLLGLSVACAQCHDHRYDPIPQSDYYALRAIFEPALDWQAWRTPQQRLVSLYTQADRQRATEVEAEAQEIARERDEKQARFMEQALEQELAKYDEDKREQLRAAYLSPAQDRSPEQQQLLKQNPSVNISPGVLYQYLPKAAEELKGYDQRIAETRAKRPPEEFLRVLSEPPGHVPVTRLFHRGDPQQPLQETPPGDLSVVAPEDEPVVFAVDDPDLASTGRRTAFANWLTSGSHPLVARVLVNRVWLHHFGRGIVETPADFGRLGARPTHPLLLDWLASEFMRSGWSLKHLHRVILLSTAWRQSSHRGERDADDPDNRLYARQNVRRLDAETLRDHMLAAAGRLSPQLYGPPQAIQEDETGQVVVADQKQQRRSLYVTMRRSQPVAMLQAFDAPVMETNCERRSESTAATQSLMLMNSDFTLQIAGQTAARALERSGGGMTGLRGFVNRELLAPPTPVWRYGYGLWDEVQRRILTFEALPFWTGSRWQGGKDLPDPQLGWVLLRADGGHPGENGYSPIRRWQAPASGSVRITGQLQHSSENGDGVHALLVSSRLGLAGEWQAANAETATNCSDLAVEAGDTLDFVTLCRGSVTSDSFAWRVAITLRDPGGAITDFDSVQDWSGPTQTSYESLQPAHLLQTWRLLLGRDPNPDEWQLAVDFAELQLRALRMHSQKLPQGVSPARQVVTNVCQALLSSNEFLYVD